MPEDRASNHHTAPSSPPASASSGGKEPNPQSMGRRLSLNSTKPPFGPSGDYRHFSARYDGKKTITVADQEAEVLIVRSPPVKRKLGTNPNEIASITTVKSPVHILGSGKGGRVNRPSKVTKNSKPVPHIPPSGSGSHFPLTSAGNSRYESSLAILTKRFINLVMHADDGIVDLSNAADVLEVKKRRIYDITNVLEGTGLIEKKLKNKIRWKGLDASEHKKEEDDVTQLQAEIERLSMQEHRLDESIRELQERVRDLSDDDNNQKKLAYAPHFRWLFVTEDDIKGLSCFQNETLIAIKAPFGTTLEVPDPDEAGDYSQRRYRIILRSTMGPIDLYLVSQFEENFEDMDGFEQPTMPIASTSGSNDNPATKSTDNGMEGKAHPHHVHTITSEHNTPKDLSGRITNIVPSGVDNHSDYWLLSDIEVPLTDIWNIDLSDIEWDGVDLQSEEFGFADVSTPIPNTPPSDAPSSSLNDTQR